MKIVKKLRWLRLELCGQTSIRMPMNGSITHLKIKAVNVIQTNLPKGEILIPKNAFTKLSSNFVWKTVIYLYLLEF